jgi:hypothetical protein
VRPGARATMALHVRPRAVTSMSALRTVKAAVLKVSCIASQEGAAVVRGLARSSWLNLATGGELPTPRRVQRFLDPSV